MNSIQDYINTRTIDEIPWHRLGTAYGLATDFPSYFHTLFEMENVPSVQEALESLESEIEHQSSLWHVTPFAMIFLGRILQESLAKQEKTECTDYLVREILSFFCTVAECYHDAEEHGEILHLPKFSDLLDETYLVPENEEDEDFYDNVYDYFYFEKEFSEEFWYSFWYYSYQVILAYRPLLEKLSTSSYHEEADQLLKLL